MNFVFPAFPKIVMYFFFFFFFLMREKDITKAKKTAPAGTRTAQRLSTDCNVFCSLMNVFFKYIYIDLWPRIDFIDLF